MNGLGSGQDRAHETCVGLKFHLFYFDKVKRGKEKREE